MTRKLRFFLTMILFMALAMGQGIASQMAGTSSPKALSPGMVNTVLGPVKAENLGVTLMHEHFVFAYPGWFSDATLYPEDWQKALKVNLGVLKLAKAVGIKTIVDATPNDVGGRNPTLYKTLAKRTGVNIICSTGLYTEHEGSPAYWRTRVPWGADISELISEVFIKEITQGIGKTGIKAGVIKVGTGPEISPYEASVLKAAAKAQKATGVPIITHTEGPKGGVEQADLLIREGADPKKIMIGHVSNSKDIDYHRAILAKGVYIAFDRIGLEVITPTEAIVKNVAALCREGHANRIMLSHDTVNYWLGRPIAVPEKYLKAFENWRIDHIHKNVIPMLKKEGVTDEQIRTMLVDNPRNLFLGK
jgi:phosphotriesterase-related protein